MEQLSKYKSILFHLYPGILITLGFVLITPIMVRNGFPPQLSMMVCIVFVAVPVFIFHLIQAQKGENRTKIIQLNGFREKLPTDKLILYSFGLLVFAFLMWGLFQPIDLFLAEHVFFWLPDWYTVQDFEGYSKDIIKITLIINLVLNGILAPVIEEFYFRGYLLPRMEVWGKWAFVVNTVLFSLYHLWQPYIYLTLIAALLPMTYLVWKTKDLRLAILTHCLLNCVGAFLSFGLVLS
ncbi:CPBP family intramembrane glutamic endopeptidase [Aquiflexum sp.]|uniref:CPBP family intramembrane glutamic endopeptidase n=1 Tax=Aquiflexum sp. TaxID=1872584 RepID=UPI0035948423